MKLDLSRALTQPFSGGAWLFNVLIGAGLLYIGSYMSSPDLPQYYAVISLAVHVYVFGYLVNVAANAIATPSNTSLPEWTDAVPTKLFTGLAGLVFLLAWAMLFFVAELYWAIIAYGTGASALVFHAVVYSGTVLLMSIVGLLGAHYASKSPKYVFHMVNVVEWFRGLRRNFLAVVAVSIITAAMVASQGAIGALPVIGAFLKPTLTFIGLVILANLWAQVYKAEK